MPYWLVYIFIIGSSFLSSLCSDSIIVNIIIIITGLSALGATLKITKSIVDIAAERLEAAANDMLDEVYIYIYICIYLHIFTHTCTYIYTYIFIYISLSTYTFTCIYAYIFIQVYTIVYMNTNMYTYLYMYETYVFRKIKRLQNKLE